jgi:L-ascorbate metabolism protein UlaG (beta-lactamase superfamily)
MARTVNRAALMAIALAAAGGALALRLPADTQEPELHVEDYRARFDGTRFIQPEPRTTGFGDWAKRMVTGKRGPWRKFTDTPPGPPPPPRVCDGELRVTFVNHATLLVQMDGVNVLTDPTWAERSVPTVGVKRHRPPGLRLPDLPPIDAVLVSHNHHDHMDLPTLRRLEATFHPAIFVGLRNAVYLAKNGVPGARDLDWWQSAEIAPGITVTAVPARHSSNRGLHDKNRTLWCGFVVSGPSGSWYFAGDTGWGRHFAAIAKRFPNLRLILMPIGGFLPIRHQREQHTGPDDALLALELMNAGTLVPMHFGTFPNSEDAETQPILTLDAGLDAKPELRPRVIMLDNGQSADIPPWPLANPP